MIDRRIAVRDPITDANGSAHLVRQCAIDRAPVGERIECRSYVARRGPAFVGDPVGGHVDALLHGQEEVEGREIPPTDVGRELFRRPVKEAFGVPEPRARTLDLGADDLTPDHAPPPP